MLHKYLAIGIVWAVALGFGTLPVRDSRAAPVAQGSTYLTPIQPEVRAGGRAVAVDVSRDGTTAIVASDTGGVFTSVDAGRSWTHQDGLPPFRMSDVKFAPRDTRVVIATALPDSRTTNAGGIWRSPDSGLTWSKPGSSEPICMPRPGAYGIAFAPDSDDVYVANDCGVAVSPDLGVTWSHVSLGSAQVRALAAQAGGILDACTSEGHRRSATRGSMFGPPSGSMPCAFVHAVAASPVERTVVFITSNVPATPPCERATAVFEGDYNQTGTRVTWRQLTDAMCIGGARDPWVATHRSRDGDPNHVDVYFGSGLYLYRQTCTLSGASDARCGTGSTRWQLVAAGHDDQNGVSFSAANNCAEYLVSDGGVYTTSDCGGTWAVAGTGSRGYNALQLYDVAGQIHPDHTDLYIGTQDNAVWGSGDGGLSWPHGQGGEGFNFQVERYRWLHDGPPITFMTCGRCGNRWSSSESHLATYHDWPSPSPTPTGWPYIVNGVGGFVQFQLVTSRVGQPPVNQLYRTMNGGETWTAIEGAVIPERLMGDVQVSGPASNPTAFIAVSRADGSVGLRRIKSIGRPTASVAAVDGGASALDQLDHGLVNLNMVSVQFQGRSVFGVDPNDACRVIAADAGTQQMRVSSCTDTGDLTWRSDPRLTELVLGRNSAFAADRFSFRQSAVVIAFDPTNRNRILVGTEAAGIIITQDGGRSWSRVPGSEQIPIITSFFFDRSSNNGRDITAYVSSYGRGLWKVNIFGPPPAPLPAGRPFLIGEEVWNVWSSGWIRDQFTGDLVDPELLMNPDWCTVCMFALAQGGRLSDIALGDDESVKALAIDGGLLRGSTGEGLDVTSELPGARLEQVSDQLSTCPGCTKVLQEGGVVKGVVLEKSRIRAVIAGFGDLPGESTLGAVTVPALDVALDPPPPGLGSTAYLHLIGSIPMGGQTSAAPGDTVRVLGQGFCADPKCGALELSIDDRVVASQPKVQPAGTFDEMITISGSLGQHTITAAQKSAEASVVSAVAELMVMPEEEEEDQD